MSKAWKITVQVGMGFWKQLQNYWKKRESDKQLAMKSFFLNMWSEGDLLCNNLGGSPHWHPTQNC